MVTKVNQALVLVGGRATRLRKGGVDVPLTKAFMVLDSEPMLYWNLCTLHIAGIRHLIIAGDHVTQLHEAHKIVKRLPYKFDGVIYFRDEGNGVHGLPYELRYLLQDSFVFDCGHGMSAPDHYKKLIKMKDKRAVVFSAYKPHPSNLRQPVLLRCGKVAVAPGADSAIAHPIVADKQYASSLLGLGFNIDAIIRYYCSGGILRYVENSLPPEYDTVEELNEASNRYYLYVVKHLLPYNK